MIPNCRGCEEELKELEYWAGRNLHFAGTGLHEKGHLFIRMVDDKGRIIIE